MSQEERKKWRRKYAEREVQPDPSPHRLLQTNLHFLEKPYAGKRALDLACGSGRDPLFLAEKGLQVTGIDIARKALLIARKRAEERHLLDHFQPVCADLDRYPLPRNHFHLISCFFYLNRQLFPRINSALCPGGLLVYRTYTRKSLEYGSRMNPAHLLKPGELGNAFSDLNVLHTFEQPIYSDGTKQRHVASLVAQKR